MLRVLFFVFELIVAFESDAIKEILETGTWILAAVPDKYSKLYSLEEQDPPCSYKYNVTKTNEQACLCNGRKAPLLHIRGLLLDGEHPVIDVDLKQLRDAENFKCDCPEHKNTAVKVLVTNLKPGLQLATICIKTFRTTCVPMILAKCAPSWAKLEKTVHHLPKNVWIATCDKNQSR